MLPTLTTRLSTSASQAARRYISNSALMKDNVTARANNPTGLAGKWKNLSSQNRRYLLAGLAVVASVDVYLHYTYWPYIRAWFGGEETARS
ncbi:DNA helicase II ATP-dependent DNA helicase [Fusarium beomiforme]|uniref:DNA helicase II ATP-dependent DNA helicase n=1 Tax=Fusarium beomiforme TaxID=44412 RepID=A0A9P5E2E2_9HYPO|nr:DNA helicase II ATP-dependent DNA helicase [Fusarium beomiforme]